MKILYGVQGTGQGHVSRARAMAAALAQWPVDVTWLFSGRSKTALFNMEIFGDFEHRRGLTFSTGGGKLHYGATLRNNNLLQFLRDARTLDLSKFDMIVSDYEPVVARAARQQGRRLIGIGHQYAFGPETPRAGSSWLQEQVMSRFAPVTVPIGLHWHPYAENVLPPILDLPEIPVEHGEHFLVYLPFEDQQAVTAILQQFSRQKFVQYSPAVDDEIRGNVLRRKANVHSFKQHLASAAGVICNSGFELISECLQWRKPVLAKPLDGQMEQHSNAQALRQLGYATVTHVFDQEALAQWLAAPQRTPDIHFPNVAEALAQWLATGCNSSSAALGRSLWQSTRSAKIPAPRPGPSPRDSAHAVP